MGSPDRVVVTAYCQNPTTSQRGFLIENTNEADATPEDWYDRVLQTRARFRKAFGDHGFPDIDITQLIHDMRQERDFQILSNLYGEAQAYQMIYGTHADEGVAPNDTDEGHDDLSRPSSVNR